MPARIEVDCEPNAHARFLHATDSIKQDGQLVLRIGLPLVAALSVQQLAGVIGHELGHFNQRRGMTCSYLIRKLTGFFAKVVFQRDVIDQKLAALRKKRHNGAKLLYLLALCFIEPMRGVLWLMLLAGELLTCGVLRQMEFDADHVEAHLSGVDDFITTSQTILMLDIAARQSRYDLANSWNQQRLADDLPQLIVANAGQLAEHRADILKLIECGKTNWFDTHPCHNDRTESVRRLGATGLIDCPDPASALFSKFEVTCHRATNAMYRSLLGESAMNGIKLVPTQELADERANHRANNKTLSRYFSGHIVQGRPIFPELIDPKSISSNDALQQVRAARETMKLSSEKLQPMIRQYAEATTLIPVAVAQLTLCQIFRNNPKSKSISAKMQKMAATQRSQRQQALAVLEDFEEAGRIRLGRALRLMSSSKVAERMGSEIVAGRIAANQMQGVCNTLEGCLPEIRELGELTPTLQVLHSAYNPKQPYQPLVKQILSTTNQVAKLLKTVQEKLIGTAYPFAHGSDGGITIGKFVVGQLPGANNVQDTCAAADLAINRYHDVAFRALSVLTLWAEKAETAANLEPLPEPTREDGAVKAAAESQNAKRTRKYWIGYGARAVAGIFMVMGLVYLSVNPPELPSMPWANEQDRDYHFRPEAFHIASYQAPAPGQFTNPSFPSAPNFPEIPGYHGSVISVQPGRPHVQLPPGFMPPSYAPPGYTPPTVPGYTPPRYQPPQFNQPRIYNPPSYNPPGMPQPPSPGFGGRSAGGMPGGGGGHK